MATDAADDDIANVEIDAIHKVGIRWMRRRGPVFSTIDLGIGEPRTVVPALLLTATENTNSAAMSALLVAGVV